MDIYDFPSEETAGDDGDGVTPTKKRKICDLENQNITEQEFEYEYYVPTSRISPKKEEKDHACNEFGETELEDNQKNVLEEIVFDEETRDMKNIKSTQAHNQEKDTICPKCAEIRNWRCPSVFKRHVATCDPIGKMCKEDHEHNVIDKTFGTFEEAVAYFYDNEYDTELSMGSGNKHKNKSRNIEHNPVFNCGRSYKGREKYQAKTVKHHKVKRTLDKKCPAHIVMRGGWLHGTNQNRTYITRMYGCTVHNHPDNPTMKRVSWLTKRRIARFLLLGHSRNDIRTNLLPKFHVEGHKRVDLSFVGRIQKIMEADKHHKLRDGHDLTSLLGKSEATLKGVYPWPTETNCPRRNAARRERFQRILATKARKKASMESKSLEESEEVERAVNSTEGDKASHDTSGNFDHTTETTQDEDLAPSVDVYVSKPKINPDLESTVHTKAEDNDVDPQAFGALQQKALRCLGTIEERLSPRIAALKASGAGTVELQRILQSSLFELLCEDLETEHPKQPPKPENVRKYEREGGKEGRRRKRKLGKPSKNKRLPCVIADDELHLGIRLRK